ncbi:coiled-coil domain-containing protein 115-like [Chironomus tepperi]|uniref:coiled-coil domain-containing protein 115-like n=1 Tax=Chironomus tepperi TaxID=113505 RepID=UPI00391EF179
MELFDNINQVKSLLDKVILQTLELVEEDLTIKISIEKLTNEGALNLAKTRYTQGSSSVSITQLPTEDEEKEFKALRTVERNEDDTAMQFTLESHEIDKDNDYIDPMHWFGILTPQTLKTARDKYQKAIELSVESANVRQRIAKNTELIQKLKYVKLQFETNEE